MGSAARPRYGRSRSRITRSLRESRNVSHRHYKWRSGAPGYTANCTARYPDTAARVQGGNAGMRRVEHSVIDQDHQRATDPTGRIDVAIRRLIIVCRAVFGDILRFASVARHWPDSAAPPAARRVRLICVVFDNLMIVRPTSPRTSTAGLLADCITAIPWET